MEYIRIFSRVKDKGALPLWSCSGTSSFSSEGTYRWRGKRTHRSIDRTLKLIFDLSPSPHSTNQLEWGVLHGSISFLDERGDSHRIDEKERLLGTGRRKVRDDSMGSMSYIRNVAFRIQFHDIRPDHLQFPSYFPRFPTSANLILELLKSLEIVQPLNGIVDGPWITIHRSHLSIWNSNISKSNWLRLSVIVSITRSIFPLFSSPSEYL